MIEIHTARLALSIDESQLTSFNGVYEAQARDRLAEIWTVEAIDLPHYHALFIDKNIDETFDFFSFVTIAYIDHGYVIDPQEAIDIVEAKKQIEIDLEIINREARWGAEESIFFDDWWPLPAYQADKQMLEFGIALKDFYQKVINRTLNRIILTRNGHIAVNYSLSEDDLYSDKTLAYFQGKLDEICQAIKIHEGYRYQDVDEEKDYPSKSRMINLILSSEIF